MILGKHPLGAQQQSKQPVEYQECSTTLKKKNVSLPASTYFAFTLTFEFLNSSRPFSLLFPRWYRSTKTSEKSNRDGLRIGRMDEFSAEKEVGGEQKKRAVLYPQACRSCIRITLLSLLIEQPQNTKSSCHIYCFEPVREILASHKTYLGCSFFSIRFEC